MTGRRQDVQEAIAIDGWGVAMLELERRWNSLGEAFPDKVFLFRTACYWSLLVLHHRERDRDGVRSGSASVTLRRFASLDELARHVESIYGPEAWYDVLEAGRDDPDLFAAWVPAWVPRAFGKASVVDKDLATASGLFHSEPLPAPGRQLPDWRQRALARVASRLIELRFQVTSALPEADSGQLAADEEPWGNVVVGQLRVRRYGFETTGVVRVDSVGEIYVRLPDDPVFEAVPEESR
jgi:hypothetical protein